MQDIENLKFQAEWLNRLQFDTEAQALEVELCARDPWHWLTNWVYTKDEHDEEEPFKQFPDKEYLREFTEVWMREKVLLVPKSRQMMISWVVVALYTWNAMFHDGRSIFFQSKKEEDANDLVGRSETILENTPSWMSGRWKRAYCSLNFLDRKSEIRGIAQGPHQIRMHTSSGIFLDEAAFMPEAEAAYRAAKPSIMGGGRITIVSSAEPSWFERIVNDRE